MEEYKNIDRLFQENFKDLEVFPPDRVWNNIENRLKQNSKGKLIQLYRRISGVAVAVLLFFSLGLGYFNPWENNGLKNIQRPINHKQQKSTDAVTGNKNVQTDNSITPKQESDANKDARLQAVHTKVKSKGVENLEREKLDLKDLKINNPERNIFTNKENTLVQSDIQDVINTQREENSQENKKWSVGTTVAPVYLNSLQKGSPISQTLRNNTISTDQSLAYGVKVDYKLSDKVKIQSGVNRVELGYNTNNVNLAVTSVKYRNNNLDLINPGIFLSSSTNTKINLQSSTTLSKSTLDGKLNQSFEYVEIPVEMKYSLYENKVGFNVVGGFSTMILTDNQVSFIQQNSSSKIGEANNLNPVNFSGNFGVDIDYKITSDWFLNLTPMFKYQFNTFSGEAGSFQPYYFGVYSGLNYKF